MKPTSTIIHQYLKDNVTTQPIWGNIKKPVFRGSQLPVCAIRWILTEIIIITAEQPIKVQTSNIYSDYFLTEGNLIHTLLQRYLGANKILYGKWRCKFPLGKPDPATGAQQYCNRIIGPQLGSEICHGQWMNYEEYEYTDPDSGLLIHIDAMLQIFKMWILGDFKTSKSAWGKDYVIPNNYYHQLNAYWWILKRLKKLFDMAAIIYIPRDYLCCNPRNWLVKPIEPNYEDWTANITSKDMAVKCIKRKDHDLFKKCIKMDLCEEESEGMERCLFHYICHPHAGISRKSHYNEMWKIFKEAA